MKLSVNSSISKSAQGEQITKPETLTRECRVAYIREVRDLIYDTGDVVKSVSEHRSDRIEKGLDYGESIDYKRTQAWNVPIMVNGESYLLTYREVSWVELDKEEIGEIDLTSPGVFSKVEPETWTLEVSRDGDSDSNQVEPFYSISTTIDSNFSDIELNGESELDCDADLRDEDFKKIIGDLTDFNFGLKEDYRE